jgi:hypothetical protein
MLKDASETRLGIIGFDRTLYGKPKDKKWWMQLRRNRMNDVQAEVGGSLILISLNVLDPVID